MIIAIIDDGICKEEISSPVEVHLVGCFKDLNFEQDDHYSHGTICAKIIEKYSSPDKIIDIPFLNKEESADLLDMCTALEYCSELKVDVINLSSGCSFYDSNTAVYARLVAVCRKLYYRGVKIFAAQNNVGNMTIPAQLPYVISVEQYDKGRMSTQSLFRRSDIYTESVHSIVLNGVKKKSMLCNSYACAYASACEIAGKKAVFKKYFVSDTINSSLISYRSKQLRNDVFELYMDESPIAVGRIYFHNKPASEQKFLKKNNMKSLVLRDDEEQIEFITECSKFFDNIEIPYVFIQRHKKAMEIAELLNSEFLTNEYKSSVISSNMNDFLSGAVYSPDKCVENFARLFAYYNSCNIMIIICNIKQQKNSDDIYIVINDNGYTLIVGGKEKKITEANRLYKEIIESF